MQSFIGSKFGDMKRSKKNVVLSLARMRSTIKINAEAVTVNPLKIFQRTVIAKKTDEYVAELLTYELTPFHLALFSEGGMRKGRSHPSPIEENKTRLIQLLTEKITAAGIETAVTTWDADGTIVRCGLHRAAVHPTVGIVGEDVDLIILLEGLAPPSINMYFMKPGCGKLGPNCENFNSFHSPRSTSFFIASPDAIYEKSKVRIDPSTSPEDIEHVGEELFLAVYQSPAHQNNMYKHRYSAFLKASTKPKSDMATFPPTSGASKQHSLRVYLQVITFTYS
ncbi:hypothetical protein JTB14_004233 [Gonioctena quinquepunctata]|nr:hypothetical protein JTB14_004233 [Gonioctena quinquepunctata]